MTVVDFLLAVQLVVYSVAGADFAITWSQRRRPVLDVDGRWRMPKFVSGGVTPSTRRAQGPRPAAVRPPARSARDVGRPSPRYQ